MKFISTLRIAGFANWIRQSGSLIIRPSPKTGMAGLVSGHRYAAVAGIIAADANRQNSTRYAELAAGVKS